jgi:hypothetical protein
MQNKERYKGTNAPDLLASVRGWVDLLASVRGWPNWLVYVKR